jgi:hypothetical protein
MLDRRTFRLTLEREDRTWGQYVFEAEDMVAALRHVARSVDLDRAQNAHVVEVKED